MGLCYALNMRKILQKYLEALNRKERSECHLPKQRAPVSVFLEREVYCLYLRLREGDEFKTVFDSALNASKENMFVGEKVRKQQTPRFYVDRYGVNNLYRLRLDKLRRCVYTLVSDGEGVKAIALEVFPEHKSYERRFGYTQG